MDPQEKTFGLSKPHEYLDKLEWEFERMMKAGQASSRELSYHAMNLAMTGWHMTDWTYGFLPADTKAQFQSVGEFRTWVKKQSRILSACRDIANSAKHLHLTPNNDPGVETVDLHYAVEGYADDYVDVEWHISVDDELLTLDDFGRGLVSFWQNYLEAQGLLPD